MATHGGPAHWYFVIVFRDSIKHPPFGLARTWETYIFPSTWTQTDVYLNGVVKFFRVFDHAFSKSPNNTRLLANKKLKFHVFEKSPNNTGTLGCQKRCFLTIVKVATFTICSKIVDYRRFGSFRTVFRSLNVIFSRQNIQKPVISWSGKFRSQPRPIAVEPNFWDSIRFAAVRLRRIAQLFGMKSLEML